MEFDLLFLLLIATLITFVTLGMVKMGNFKNPLTVYLCFWGIWLGISMLDPLELYHVSDQAYLLLWTNIVFFSLGYLFFSKRIENRAHLEVKLTKQNKKLLLLLQCLLLLILVYYARKFFLLLGQDIITNARTIKYEVGLLFSSYAEYAFFNFFIEAFVYISTILTVCYYISINKTDRIVILGIVCVIAFAYIGLGRFIIFDALVFYLLATTFRCRQRVTQNNGFLSRNHKGNIFYYILFGLVAILGMVMVTTARLGNSIFGVQDYLYIVGYSFEQLIIYFTGPFRAFDTFLASKVYEEIGYTLGRSTFSGIEEILYNYLYVTEPKWAIANEKMSNFTVPNITIGNRLEFNAFYTGVMNFYLDGGLVGVIGLAFLYGSIAALIYNYYRVHPNIFNYGLFIFFTYTTIASEFRLAFGAPSTWLILFVLALLGTRTAHKFLRVVISRDPYTKSVVHS